MGIERVEQTKQVGDYEITLARVKNINIQKIGTYDKMLEQMLKVLVAFILDSRILIERD